MHHILYTQIIVVQPVPTDTQDTLITPLIELSNIQKSFAYSRLHTHLRVRFKTNI